MEYLSSFNFITWWWQLTRNSSLKHKEKEEITVLPHNRSQICAQQHQCLGEITVAIEDHLKAQCLAISADPVASQHLCLQATLDLP